MSFTTNLSLIRNMLILLPLLFFRISLKSFLILVVLSTAVACIQKEERQSQSTLRFEKINFYTYPVHTLSKPFQSRLTYYFDNGKPHRWLLLDSVGRMMTDYIYAYDDAWIHKGARYREDGEKSYDREVVKFLNDSTQITEWIDSLDRVFYTMTDYLNEDGKTFRAEFKGDVVHGWDSTFYTQEGFQKRIFFTNTKGVVLNDRTFEYDSLNTEGDWVVRKKIMDDTIWEVHVREVLYDNTFTSIDGVFYPGVLSTGEWSENTFSFTKDYTVIFQMRTEDWDHQFAYIAQKENGLFTESTRIESLDTIYNGAISPEGSKIIFCRKEEDIERTYLMKKVNGEWTKPYPLAIQSGVSSGYFYWYSEDELYFYVSEENGNIVQGRLAGDSLVVTDPLMALNTESGTEFSPYVDPKNRFIIFTRYMEGNFSQQGFFISYNKNLGAAPDWSKPEKLSMLPYGWNAFILNEKIFLYTDGEDIISVPIEVLELQI